MSRPILILCERCQSEGRLLTNNGGPDDVDHGECPECEGTGSVLIESERVTEFDNAY